MESFKRLGRSLQNRRYTDYASYATHLFFILLKTKSLAAQSRQYFELRINHKNAINFYKDLTGSETISLFQYRETNNEIY